MTTFFWAECSVNLLTTFLLVTKSFAQLNLLAVSHALRTCNEAFIYLFIYFWFSENVEFSGLIL